MTEKQTKKGIKKKKGGDKIHSVSDKQKLLLALIYTTYEFPIDALQILDTTFTQSNIRYKLIPNLIKAGYITRVKIGFNKYGENEIQKGKKLYDVIKLTPLGTEYIDNIIGTKNNSEMKIIRSHYKNLKSRNENSVEERFKRTILTDMFLGTEYILNPILNAMTFGMRVLDELKKDMNKLRMPSRYYRGIDIKRQNGELNRYVRYNDEKGNNITSSKTFGIIQVGTRYLPVYNAGYHNVGITTKKEIGLINKIISQTKEDIEQCIYIYQNIENINRMIYQYKTKQYFTKQQNILEVSQYKQIYLLEYGDIQGLKNIIKTKDEEIIIKSVMKEQCKSLISTEAYKKAKTEKYQLFDAIDNDYNYTFIINIDLREVVRLKNYLSTHKKEKLCIICTKDKKETLTKLYKELKDNNKLFFIIIPS